VARRGRPTSIGTPALTAAARLLVRARRLLIVIPVVVAPAAITPAVPPIVLVEDWSRHTAGTAGVPDGWQRQDWGLSKYDFTVVADGPRKVLRMRSDGDNSIISKKARIVVRQSPILVWRWKVVTLPAKADSRHRETDDQAAQIYVAFPRFPERIRSRLIGYVWDTTAPAGTIVKSPSASAVTYVIVRSGPADMGRWLTETRNVYEDYKQIYGEEPPEEIGLVSLAIDSNDTRSSAESWVGEILFRGHE
jgi:Protein of unknown function (DUF3047)